MGDAEAALQQRINTFDAARDGYSDLQDWTAELETLQAKVADTEERWLAIAERA